MASLLIDTCTEEGLLLFFQGSELLFSAEMPKGLHNSKAMMSGIDRGLKELGLSIRELTFIAVTIGPGSYTGIRIGAMAAKTFSYAAGVPIVTLSSLEGYLPYEEGPFTALIDAKIGGAYYREGQLLKGEVEWRGEPSIGNLEEMAPQLKSRWLVTPNKEALEKRAAALYPGCPFQWVERPPSWEQLMKSANGKFLSGQVERETNFPLLYLRKTQAEIERDERERGSR